VVTALLDRDVDGGADAVVAGTDPTDQARALGDLAIAAAEAGDFDRAGRLLSQVLIMGELGIWWATDVSRCFPSVVGGAWDILAGAYVTGHIGLQPRIRVLLSRSPKTE
jgi:hypothetical protein